MRYPLRLFIFLMAVHFLVSPAPALAPPDSRDSIDWVIANSDRAIIGKVVKVTSIIRHTTTIDKQGIVTVEIQRILRGEQESKGGEKLQQLTFLTQKDGSGDTSGFAQGWLDEKQPMIFFLLRSEGADRDERLPKDANWVLHSAVLLGKTELEWPGTIDVFTQKFDYLTNPDEIVKYVAEYARSIPAGRVEKSRTVDVPYGTLAYEKVFPPKYRQNAFYLRVPDVEKK